MTAIYIGATKATALERALRQNTTLKEFFLRDIEIEDVLLVVTALAEALRHNTTLMILRVTANNIGDGGAAALGVGWLCNKTLP